MTYTLRTPEEVYFTDGDFTVTRHFEFIGGQWRTYIHTEFHRFSPSILRKVDRVFPILRAGLPPVIGAVLNHDKTVGPHYMRRYGFYPAVEIAYDDGKTRTLWLHVLARKIELGVVAEEDHRELIVDEGGGHLVDV